MIQTLRNFFTSPKYSLIWRILALVFVIGLSIYIYSIRNDAQKLIFLGYPGIFLLSFLAYATVILPAPGLAIIFTMGGVLGRPLIVAIIASLGATIGEMIGYLAGFTGGVTAENNPTYQKIRRWMERYGIFTIVVLAAIPNPFFDVAGIAAGALKISTKKFIFWCWVGQIIKMLIFAYGGSGLLKNFL